ncbi:MAG: CBS domain-containing protein [Symbiobacterium sp.]|uniref:CBS domain-containing protein n=1 Tax=Symbiobacterium sp. TaxID=1971213 RepID=UPI0034649F83
MQIIVPHINSDLDAIGAAIGAQVLYPQARIVLPGSANPMAAEFLSLHRYNLRVYTPKEIDLSRVQRAIVVDTADAARLGALRSIVSDAELHLYDHHPPEEHDLQGEVEVRAQVGATCTLIAELIEEAGAPITPFQATALLVGIYADTGSLSLLGTTDRDARAAAFLLEKGASLQAATRFMEVSLSPAQQTLLQQLQGQARWVNVHGARIRLLAAEVADYVGGLNLVIHRLMELEPVPALFAVVRMGDRVYLVGRASVPWVDAARVLGAFGGGGHASAASAVVKGLSLEEVTRRLEAALPEGVDRPLMARDVMSSPVKSILATKPIRDAERLMLRHGHTGLPVVDDSGTLVGVVSLRDVEKARRHGLEHAPVKSVMKSRVIFVGPDTPADEVQELMIAHDIGRVPVVENGNLVGIITRSDILGLIYGAPAPRWHRRLYAAPEEPKDLRDEAVQRALAAVEAAPAGIRSLLRAVGHAAEQEGVAVYAVGGFVRDLLLGRPNLDFDIVVEGDGIAFAHTLARELGGKVQEVPRFGTAHVYLEQQDPALPSRIDVATARREFYEQAAALPRVEHADLHEDLYRRDFSINAIAIRLGSAGPSGLIDFFGGLQDLVDGQVRILHTLSFVEDPTRLLRAVRFAHRYGFRLEPETEACARAAIAEGFLNRVSRDRLRNELLLILQEPGSGGALRLLADLGGLGAVLPGVLLDAEVEALVDRVDELPETAPELSRGARLWLVKLLALLHRLPLAEGAAVVRHLRLKRPETQACLHVLAGWRIAHDLVTAPRPDPAAIVSALAGWPPEGLLLLVLLGGGERVGLYWQEWRHIRLEITGADVQALGVPPGPRIRRVLERVLAARLSGEALDRAAQLALAQRYAEMEEE